jgi:prepilin-type processing-associated H-X9-DG protein
LYPNIKAPHTVPLFLDLAQTANLRPLSGDEPPEFAGQLPFGEDHLIRRACIDRHNGGVNCLMMDYAVRKIGLKQLWDLNWHRKWLEYERRVPPWPNWMKGIHGPR